jgi:hypothetical protein
MQQTPNIDHQRSPAPQCSAIMIKDLNNFSDGCTPDAAGEQAPLCLRATWRTRQHRHWP